MNVNFKQASQYYEQNYVTVAEQQSDDLMLGNLPIFNANYCD